MVSSNYTSDMEDSSNMVLITIHLLIILLPILLKKALRQIQKMVLHSLRGKWDVHESLHHEVVTLYTIHMVLYSYFDQIDNYSICYPSFLQNIYLSNVFYASVYILDGQIITIQTECPNNYSYNSFRNMGIGVSYVE